MMARQAFFVLVALLAPGCVREDAGPEHGEACPEGWTCERVQPSGFGGLDVMVVVDNSMSMAEEQEMLATQLPRLFARVLDPPVDPETGRAAHAPITDLHVGVVSTDMGTGGYHVETCVDSVDGDGGELRSAPGPSAEGCEDAYPLYLEQRGASGPGDLAQAFGCVARLGTDGCGWEQQLEAMLAGLVEQTRPGGYNEGFLRPDSAVLVVWITDEDDCSIADAGLVDPTDSSLGHLCLRCFHHPDMLQPLGRYQLALDALRKDRRWPVLLGMIVGVPLGEARCTGFGDEIGSCLDIDVMRGMLDPVAMTRLVPACSTSTSDALPATRMVDLAVRQGRDAFVQSVCREDLDPLVEAMAGRLGEVALDACDMSATSMDRDPADPCLCTSACSVVRLVDGPCPEGLEPWDPDEDGRPDLVPDGGWRHACVVPRAGTRVTDCEAACDAPGQGYSAAGEGWYYGAGRGVGCPSVAFTEGYGGEAFIACPP